MDPETSTPEDAAPDGDGQYLQRAQALMARCAELFSTPPALNVARTGLSDSSPQDRPKRTRRAGGRQLSLPIARERGRRRARMLG